VVLSHERWSGEVHLEWLVAALTNRLPAIGTLALQGGGVVQGSAASAALRRSPRDSTKEAKDATRATSTHRMVSSVPPDTHSCAAAATQRTGPLCAGAVTSCARGCSVTLPSVSASLALSTAIAPRCLLNHHRGDGARPCAPG
jgi:hypothetical protein